MKQIKFLTNGIKESGGYLRLKNPIRLSSGLSNDGEYIPVPHYREKSALFTKYNLPNESFAESFYRNQPIFPKIIWPELDLKCIFEAENMYKSALSINLNARHIHLDLARLKQDYFQMKQMEDSINSLEKQKLEISNTINNLVKLKGKLTDLEVSISKVKIELNKKTRVVSFY